MKILILLCSVIGFTTLHAEVKKENKQDKQKNLINAFMKASKDKRNKAKPLTPQQKRAMEKLRKMILNAAKNAELEKEKRRKTEQKRNLARLNKFLQEWQKIAKKHGFNYKYQITNEDEYGTNIQTVVFKKNKPISRSFKRIKGKKVIKKWNEVAANLGDHAYGKPIRTVKQLVAYCKGKIITRKNNAIISVDFDKQGFLSRCMYTSTNLRDTKYVNVGIENIKIELKK